MWHGVILKRTSCVVIMARVEPDPEPSISSVRETPPHPLEAWDWYWEYRQKNRRYRWFPVGWEFRCGSWGEWWEVWEAVEGRPWYPNKGHQDGRGRARRTDRFCWKPVDMPW